MNRLSINPFQVQFLDGGQYLGTLALVENALQLPFPDGIEHVAVLVAEQGFLLLVRKQRISGAVGVRSRPFSDATAPHKHLGLEQKLRLAGFALHVVHSIAVLHVGVEPENHGIFFC